MISKSTITNITAEEILDSRGNPTIEATVTLANGLTATAAVPSGASTGRYEALELRDNDAGRYAGKGVLQACANVVEKIFPALKGKKVQDQRTIDKAMIALDGSANKKNLGANAILAVSLACARVGAMAENVPLYSYLRASYNVKVDGYPMPIPMLNIFNGGRHADNGMDFQEYMILPHATTFAERMRMASEVSMHLGSLLKSKSLSTLVGDEGGFAPHLKTNTEPLDLISEAVGRTPYRLGEHITFGLDTAASEFYVPSQKKYFLSLEQAMLTSDELITRYKEVAQSYPLTSLEDGLDEDDWDGWTKLTETLNQKLLIIGDDLFVTNKEKLAEGIKRKAANAILIKVNQIGTLTETMETIALAREHGYVIVISHRSGETVDSFIADLAVAVGAPYIKAGAVSRGERLAKYNRLLEIEEETR